MAGIFFPLRKAVKWVNLSSQWGFPGSSAGKESACNVGDLDLIPGLGRSPAGGDGNPLQSSCLLFSTGTIPMDRGAWQVTNHGLAKSQT